MKTMASSVVLALSLALPMAYADDRHHPQNAESGKQTTAPQGKGTAGMDRMQEMRKTMDRLHATTDPKERERLMQEHMDQMEGMMNDMHGTMGKGMGSAQSGDHQQSLEKRMDMMQGMMEQMMGHMKAQGGAEVKGEAGKDKQHDHDDSGKRRKLEM